MSSSRTRYLGVIGWPVAHSLSPQMQEAGFRALGLDLRYGAFPVEPTRLVDAFAGAEALGFVGLNVTVPHKESVVRLCRPDDEARRIGAVNTVVFGDGVPRGYNTDVHGFRALLVEAGIDARGARAIVLGAGGASRAVVWALVGEGAEVTVVSRSDRKVLFEDGPLVEHVPWDDELLARLLATADLLVDATPRGFDAGHSLDLSPLGPRASVVDVAAIAQTPLVTAALARGLRATTGVPMLLHQGVRAFEAFTGQPAPVEIMRAALLAAL